MLEVCQTYNYGWSLCYDGGFIRNVLWQFTPHRPGTRPMSDAERIHAAVEDQLTNCQCHSQFSIIRVDDGKYKVGNSADRSLLYF